MTVRKRLFKLCDELFEKNDENTQEIFAKKTALLFGKKDASTNCWYLYQINIHSNGSVNGQLGFIVPSELIELPRFNDGNVTIVVIFRKVIDWWPRRSLFERFSKHIFEHVFDYTTFEFNIHSSTFKLLPCLLTSSNEIDDERMSDICHRYDKSVDYPSGLSSTELYTVSYLPTRPLYMHQLNASSPKRAAEAKTGTQTYAEYYEKAIPNLHIQRDRLMGSMRTVNKMKLSLAIQEYRVLSIDQTIYYYPIELLRYAPLNQRDLGLFSLLSSVLFRIVQLYHLERLRKLFAEKINCYPLMRCSEITFKDGLTKYMQMVALNRLNYDLADTSDHLTAQQPSSDILFQATTRCSAGEAVDMENLEILGDCFLKFAVSMSLYYRSPLATVGELNNEKITEISNENLYRLAVENNLRNYLYCDPVVFQGKDANWLPPGFVVKKSDVKRHTHQKVKRKAFADMIEALIGAFLISTNHMTTIRLMHWLGLNVLPIDQNGCIIVSPPVIAPLLKDEIHRIFHHERFDDVEAILQYVFRDKAYLVTAFTHASKSIHGVPNSYERLEFLGDALLDFLIVRYTFLNYDRHVTPGRVTDIRQDLASNNRLAQILVSSGLHTKVRHQSEALSKRIQTYVNASPKTASNTCTRSTAPKVLADVFEALIAAIFLDSGNSLETVWKVVEPLLGRSLDRSIIDPNLNPMRSLLERGGRIIEEFIDETGAVCKVRMPNGDVFEGHGTNKKLAKSDACQQALNYRNLNI